MDRHNETGTAALPAIDIQTPSDEISPQEIRALLADILRSKAFSMSKRCGEFLGYIVEQTLLGMEHELKERTIGIAAFGRLPAYDTGEDAIVRIKASETRRRLASYYAECGKNATILLSLPTGAYVPHFTRIARPGVDLQSAAILKTPATFIRAAPQSSAQPGRKALWIAIAACSCIVLAIVPAIRWSRTPQPTIINQFWSPVLNQPAPIYLVISSVPAYLAYGDPSPASSKSSQKYVLTTDQFIGRGDMLAGERISTMLRALGHSPALKASDSIDMREVSNHAVVLIGYASTRWAALSKDLRYYIDDERGGMITDAGNPTNWYPHHLTPDLHTDEDYALVARVYDPETRSVVVLVSGATQYGTEAAANLVTDPGMLAEALRGKPANWFKGNIQLVLHIKVIGNTPAAPEVVASDFR